MLIRQNKKNRGFVILYAVIITTIVLIVGVSLMNIITKQLVLSSISRNSKIAYYAALSGRECAEFWKTVQMVNFNSPTYFGGYGLDNDGNPYWVSPSDGSIICSGLDLPTTVSFLDGGITRTQFNFDLTLGNGQQACANVTVIANPQKQGDCASDQLLISSEGYNSSCVDTLGSNPNPRMVKSIYRDKESCPEN
jgi:hypothetical protein